MEVEFEILRVSMFDDDSARVFQNQKSAWEMARYGIGWNVAGLVLMGLELFGRFLAPLVWVIIFAVALVLRYPITLEGSQLIFGLGMFDFKLHLKSWRELYEGLIRDGHIPGLSILPEKPE
jgi:hypothetical protein